MNRVKTVLIGLAVIFASAGIAQAATTIGTDITTGGALSVTGLSSVGQASTTMLSAGTAYFGTSATSTFSSNGSLALSSVGTFSVTGASVLGVTTLGVTTAASTTAVSFQVGQLGTHMSQIVAGYCVTDTTSVAVASTYGNFTASSTPTYRVCTPVPAVTLSAGSRVFVQATSSLPFNIFIQSASTTPATGAISVELVNTSTTTASTAPYAFNFWAFQ